MNEELKQRIEWIESRLNRLEKLIYVVMVIAFPSAINSITAIIGA